MLRWEFAMVEQQAFKDEQRIKAEIEAEGRRERLMKDAFSIMQVTPEAGTYARSSPMPFSSTRTRLNFNASSGLSMQMHQREFEQTSFTANSIEATEAFVAPTSFAAEESLELRYGAEETVPGNVPQSMPVPQNEQDSDIGGAGALLEDGGNETEAQGYDEMMDAQIISTAVEILRNGCETLESQLRGLTFLRPISNFSIETVIERIAQTITTGIRREGVYEARPPRSALGFGRVIMTFLKDYAELNAEASVWNLDPKFTPLVFAIIMASKTLGKSIWIDAGGEGCAGTTQAGNAAINRVQLTEASAQIQQQAVQTTQVAARIDVAQQNEGPAAIRQPQQQEPVQESAQLSPAMRAATVDAQTHQYRTVSGYYVSRNRSLLE